MRPILALLLAAFLAAPALVRAEDVALRPWIIDGKPVDPACLLPIADLTGQSSVVDLADCGSDIVITKDVFHRPDLIGFSYKEKGETSDWPNASFYYRYVGRVGDKDIIYALYSGGGTGVFDSLVALRRQTTTSGNSGDTIPNSYHKSFGWSA
jgi:hypothetical protein